MDGLLYLCPFWLCLILPFFRFFFLTHWWMLSWYLCDLFSGTLTLQNSFSCPFLHKRLIILKSNWQCKFLGPIVQSNDKRAIVHYIKKTLLLPQIQHCVIAIVITIQLISIYPLYMTADNGSLHFWDWKTGYNFQRIQSTVQPGSIDSENGIFALTWDQSGSRLLTAEADKSIKIYKEDDSAVSTQFVLQIEAPHVRLKIICIMWTCKSYKKWIDLRIEYGSEISPWWILDRFESVSALQ